MFRFIIKLLKYFWLNFLFLSLILPIAKSWAETPISPFFEKQIILKRTGSGAYAIPKIVVTSNGTAIIVAQDRDGGDWGKRIQPICLRSADSGKSWTTPFLLIPDNFPDRNNFILKPTGIVVDRCNNRIFVFINRSPLPTLDLKIDELWFYRNIQKTRDLGRAWFLVFSDDDGQNWSKPREITQQLIKKPHWQEWSPVHTGIQLEFGPHKGRLVLPVRCYCPDEDPSEHNWKYQFNGVLYSDDGGNTWIPGGRSDSYLGECSIAERLDGSIYSNHRTSKDPARKSERMHNISNDGGVSFTPCTYAGIPDARCHAGLTALTKSDGKRVFLLTNVPGPERNHLTIGISENEGKTWKAKKVIESGPSAYSDIVVLPDRTILCVYETGEEHSRQHLAVARFNVAWLFDQKQKSVK